MMSFIRRRTIYGLAFLLLMCVASAQGQTTPSSNPAQQDATRPPGQERRQSVPQEARPNSTDPTAPPGTQLPSPQSPTWGDTLPSSNPATTPAAQTPQSPATSDNQTGDAPASVDAKPESLTTHPQQDLSQRPLLEMLPARPVPPLPSLRRLGIEIDQALPLSLDDAIRRALENNTEIDVARVDVRLAESALHSLEGVYDPVFQTTPQFSRFVTPQSSTLGGSSQGGTVTRTLIDADPSLTRLFKTGGGQYQVFFNNTRETTTSIFTQFNPVYSANLGMTFTQPLARNRSVDNNRRLIRIQRKRLEQSDADFRRRTIDVIAQVQRAYWELVFALRDQQNRVANLNLIRQQFLQTEQRIAAGATAPIERAEVQTELSNRETDVLQSVQNVAQVENALKRLIIRDPLAAEWSVPLVPTEQTAFDAEVPIKLEDALEEARANRPELHRSRLQQEIADIDLDYYKNQLRPRIDLQSTISTTGLAGSVAPAATFVNGQAVSSGPFPLIGGDPATSASAFLLSQVNQLRAAQGLPAATVPLVTPQGSSSVPSNLVGGYGQMLQNLLGLHTHNIVVGVAVELPLRNRTARANFATARLQREQLLTITKGQELDIEIEVRNAVQAAEIARRRVLAARLSRENAEVQLEGEKRLYKVGQSTTFLLFQRENQLTNARNSELRAETDYNKALVDLQRATSTTLQANHVIVQDPLGP